MSINAFVEMTIFLCLIYFSTYAKMQGFEDECVFFSFAFNAEIQDVCKKWQEKD